jgi:hypothetical protein
LLSDRRRDRDGADGNDGAESSGFHDAHPDRADT